MSSNIHGKAMMGVSGYYKYKLWNADGTLAEESDWQKNLITNKGLETLITDDFANYAAIGFGNTAAAVTDTALESLGGFNNTGFGVSNRTNSGAPDYTFSTVDGWRFNAGNGTGTIREFGVFPANSHTNCSSRIVLTTPIVKGATQVLDMYHKLIIQLKLTDTVVNNVDIPEDGVSVFYNTITRPCDIDASPSAPITYEGFNCLSRGENYKVYTGPIGSITSQPSGTSTSGGVGLQHIGGVVQASDYAYQDIRGTWGLNYGNVGGIRSIRIWANMNFAFQIEYTDVATGTRLIPKNSTKEIYFDWRIQWNRV